MIARNLFLPLNGARVRILLGAVTSRYVHRVFLALDAIDLIGVRQVSPPRLSPTRPVTIGPAVPVASVNLTMTRACVPGCDRVHQGISISLRRFYRPFNFQTRAAFGLHLDPARINSIKLEFFYLIIFSVAFLLLLLFIIVLITLLWCLYFFLNFLSQLENVV